jgi:hypothetical protein
MTLHFHSLTGVVRNGLSAAQLAIIFLFINHLTLEAQDTDYEQWKNSFNADFNTYSDSLNKAFSSFLQKAWVEMGVQKPVKSFEQPKPLSPPSLVEEEKEIDPIGAERPIIKLPPPVPTSTISSNNIDLFFFGQNWQLTLLGEIQGTSGLKTFSEKDIATFWKNAENEVSAAVISSLKDEIATNQLSDWAVYQLVRNWIEVHSQLNERQKKLYSWYIMQQMGYDVRLGLSTSQVVLLLSFDEPLYDITYYTLDGRKYYQIEANGESTNVGRIRTYDGIAGRPFYWIEEVVPNMGNESEIISRSFNFEGETFQFEMPINRYRIAYLNQLPRSRPELYEKLQPELLLTDSLDAQLKPILTEKTELQKAQFLLSFVQLGFDYKTDEQHFGKEKFMAPEETIWYPFSDCEDRSALYAWLLSRYTQLDYAFVRYPSHIAVALKETSLQTQSDSIEQRDGYSLNGSYYILADPTYIGAKIGMEMPKLKTEGKLITP